VNDKIEDIQDYNVNNLHVQTDNVLELVKENAPGWEDYVPAKVAAIIRERSLFGFPE
jgi:hypothetical protein